MLCKPGFRSGLPAEILLVLLLLLVLDPAAPFFTRMAPSFSRACSRAVRPRRLPQKAAKNQSKGGPVAGPDSGLLRLFAAIHPFRLPLPRTTSVAVTARPCKGCRLPSAHMPDAPPSGLHVTDLHFAYPGAGQAFRLQVPHLQLEPGKALALAGPSGAGKSTLVRLLTGLLEPTAGHVHLGATALSALGAEQQRAFRLQHIGLVFQDFALLDYLTVLENILLPHQFGGGKGAAATIQGRAEELVQKLQISAYLHQRVSLLSQGERQRVAVARALVHQPQFIFADEPTASLDPARGRIVVDLLLEDVRRRGACLVMVTHDPNLLPLFDQTVRMEDFAAA